MPSNHLILYCHLLLLPSIFPSIRVFYNEVTLCIRWPNYWSLSFSISPSNEYSGLIFWGLTSLISLQSKGLSRIFSKTTVQKYQFFSTQLFFIVQLSHPYMTTGKTIALTRQTFVGKVMSLLFNMLSRFIITFLPRNKHLLISSAVTICSDFGTQENKASHCFHCFPSICHEAMGLDARILVFRRKKFPFLAWKGLSL